MTDKEQLVKGWIDTLIENNGSWVILDHKFTTKPDDKLEAEALKCSGQITAYKHAVEAETSKNVESCWVHFPDSGMMFQIMI